jgi:hypothetical protein
MVDSLVQWQGLTVTWRTSCAALCASGLSANATPYNTTSPRAAPAASCSNRLRVALAGNKAEEAEEAEEEDVFMGCSISGLKKLKKLM